MDGWSKANSEDQIQRRPYRSCRDRALAHDVGLAPAVGIHKARVHLVRLLVRLRDTLHARHLTTAHLLEGTLALVEALPPRVLGEKRRAEGSSLLRRRHVHLHPEHVGGELPDDRVGGRAAGDDEALEGRDTCAFSSEGAHPGRKLEQLL